MLYTVLAKNNNKKKMQEKPNKHLFICCGVLGVLNLFEDVKNLSPNISK